eukprot:CAMPEP_0204579610 /NCGR_PEP_ID=MMETSP0661-20131031/43598_1 /ASSEMBLY_ACC=CAM_ASM_000606 /TAXON_ID=109239 /ORGANISM="Alexandrium margalefi, Strain AMGDE01CS-322" /LENGTH=58 /DNA_ID=CAMNT_0051588643 /DNA_START=118 /DNA_END=290 /DNA_ORIENTATION=-
MALHPSPAQAVAGGLRCLQAATGPPRCRWMLARVLHHVSLRCAACSVGLAHTKATATG